MQELYPSAGHLCTPASHVLQCTPDDCSDIPPPDPPSPPAWRVPPGKHRPTPYAKFPVVGHEPKK